MSPLGYGVPGFRGTFGPAVAAEYQHFWAFADSGGFMQAWEYNGGGWYADRAASLTYSTPAGNLCCGIAVDSSALVGNGSLVWLEGGTTVVVWDVAASAYYTATAQTAGTMTPPVYVSGYVWWWEYPATWASNSATMTLVKATTDLQTIITYTQALAFTEAAGSSIALWAHLYTDTAAYLGIEGTGAETTDYPIAKITLAGSGSAATSTVEWNGGNWPLIPGPTGVAIGNESFNTSPTLQAAADTTPGAIFADTQWPTTGSWALDVGYNVSATSDGAIASTYGELSTVQTIVCASSTATAGEPTLSTATTAHPVLGVKPALMMLKG